MLDITVQVDALPDQAEGIKEDLAAYLEQYGDVRAVSIKECRQEQLSMWGAHQ